MSPLNVVGIDHLVLRVADLEAARAFYEDVLGCQQERSLPELGLYQLRAGEQLIDLVPIGSTLGGTEPVNQSQANQDHFCLTIDPFDETQLLDYLSAQGIACSEVAQRYGAHGFGPSVYIKDPDGNTVELKGSQGSFVSG